MDIGYYVQNWGGSKMQLGFICLWIYVEGFINEFLISREHWIPNASHFKVQ